MHDVVIFICMGDFGSEASMAVKKRAVTVAVANRSLHYGGRGLSCRLPSFEC
jgi:hypothetical protein